MILGFANFDFEKCPKIQKIEKKIKIFENIFSKKIIKIRENFSGRVYFLYLQWPLTVIHDGPGQVSKVIEICQS